MLWSAVNSLGTQNSSIFSLGKCDANLVPSLTEPSIQCAIKAPVGTPYCLVNLTGIIGTYPSCRLKYEPLVRNGPELTSSSACCLFLFNPLGQFVFSVFVRPEILRALSWTPLCSIKPSTGVETPSGPCRISNPRATR